MTRLTLALSLLAAGCASPLATLPDGPASQGAEVAPHTVALGTLPLAPQPDLPRALRPDDRAPVPMADHGGSPRAGMEHGAKGESATHHASDSEMPAPSAVTPDGLVAALDAYLAVHDALTSDDLSAAVASARQFHAAFAEMTARAPADAPHLWHQQHDRVATIRAAALALVAATHVNDARAAFGDLSLPFANLVGTTGVPEGYDLTRHTCGMADAPAGGVWLQRDGASRNPYFGTAMLSCGRPTGEAAEASMEMETDPLHMDHRAH